MNSGTSFCCLLATMLASGQAWAQTPQIWSFGTVISGSYTNKNHNLNCTGFGPDDTSTFAFGSSSGTALMSLQLNYSLSLSGGKGSETSYNGIARLLFTSATAGTISYDEILTSGMQAATVEFTKYAATYDSAADTLTVAMTIKIDAAKPCSFDVSAIYRMP